MSTETERAEFCERLRDRLVRCGIQFVSAENGRTAESVAWVVTVEHGRGGIVRSHEVQVPFGHLTCSTTLEHVVEQIVGDGGSTE